MKIGSNIIRVIIVAAGVSGALGSFVTYGRSTSDPRFREVIAKRGDITASVVSSGTVQPDNRVDVKGTTAGRAEEVLVNEGDHVEKGQILMWMSSNERATLIDAARARGPEELAKWEDLYRATPILAPVSGTIIQRNVESGQTFANTDAILVMSDRLIVEAPVDETDIAQIKKGQKTTLILDAYPKHTLPSHVGSVAYEATVKNNVTTYMVRIVIEKVPEFVRAGMTANVSFDISSKRGVILVPAEAVKSKRNETYVLVPPEHGKEPVKRNIQTGMSDGRMIEVTEGLRENEVLLVPLPLKPEESNTRSSVFSITGP